MTINSEITQPYDVALSYASEDRNYVEKVALLLKEKNVKVFYDRFEEVNLWGKDLATYLNDIFENRSLYTVIFLSKNYKDKVWTNHERQSALSRALKNNTEYLLPVRFDDTSIPGISSAIKYLNANEHSPEEIANLIYQKLNLPKFVNNNLQYQNKVTLGKLEQHKLIVGILFSLFVFGIVFYYGYHTIRTQGDLSRESKQNQRYRVAVNKNPSESKDSEDNFNDSFGSTDFYYTINMINGPPNVRLRYPYPVLEPYPIRKWPAEIDIVQSLAYIFLSSVKDTYNQPILHRENAPLHNIATDYFPIKPGLRWTYNKHLFGRYGIRERENDNVLYVKCPLLFLRRFETLYQLDTNKEHMLKAIVESKQCLLKTIGKELENDYDSNEKPPEKRAMTTAETYIVGVPLTENGRQFYPVSISIEKGIEGRDGRYNSHMKNNFWFIGKYSDMSLIYEKTTYMDYPIFGGSNEEPQVTIRPLIFDSYHSFIYKYKTNDTSFSYVRHGYLVESALRPIVTPAGKFNDCLRVTEYLLGSTGTDAEQKPQNEIQEIVNQGWITISWYARDVGLVSEVQMMRSGSITYIMELSEYSK